MIKERMLCLLLKNALQKSTIPVKHNPQKGLQRMLVGVIKMRGSVFLLGALPPVRKIEFERN